MLTTDRQGNPLPADVLTRMLADGRLGWTWSLHIIDMAGRPLTPSAWTPYAVDVAALVGLPRRNGKLDDPTWDCQITLLAAMLHPDVPVRQYHRVEIDIIPYGGQPIPYFTGIIDEVTTRDELAEGGGYVRLIDLSLQGVLQRAKGYWFDLARISPSSVTHSANFGRLVALCPRRRIRVVGDIPPQPNNTEKIPFAITYSVTNDAANQLVISPNSNMTSPYVRGTNYTVDTSTTPPTVTWLTDPADIRYFEAPIPERIGIAVNDGQTGFPAFIVLPFGREPDDLYHTRVRLVSTDKLKITPDDPTAIISLLDITQGEWLTVINSTGVAQTRKITMVDGVTGKMTVDAAFTNDPAIGDDLWISTTELQPAWLHNDASTITFFKDTLNTVKHKRAAFRILPNAGLAVPELPYNFLGGNNDGIFTATIWRAKTLTEDSGNGVESVIKTLLTTTGLFSSSDISATNSGVVIKNVIAHDQDMADFLAELKQKALPPNSYIHDTLAGSVTIRPYRQATEPDWQLHAQGDISEEAIPDPITRVVVQARDRDENRAPLWYRHGLTSNVLNPTRIIDGSTKDAATQVTAGSPIKVGFRIPTPSPKESFPNIKRIEVHGRGILTVYTVRDPDGSPTTYYPKNLHRIVVSGGQSSGSDPPIAQYTIHGDDLLPGLTPSDEHELIIEMDEDDSVGVVAPVLTEVKIIVEDLVAWAAALTDDATGMPSGWNPDPAAFGAVWAQPDTKKRESFRFAPSAHLKRVLTIYDTSGAGIASRANQRHRTKLIELTGISQQDARDLAEAYLDEIARFTAQYKVSAPLFPLADRGDTVLVHAAAGMAFSDGAKVKTLFLAAIETDGEMATYTLVDYN